MRLYKTSDCTGAVAVNNATKAQFAAGVTLPAVPDDSSTQIGAIAVDGTRQSTCSTPLTYVEDSDFDNDGLIDESDPDDDNDGVLDAGDNCILAVNPNQLNNDGDAQGDACDADDDNDGVADGSDNCVLVANGDRANHDIDSTGDACDEDDDNDGLTDAQEAAAGTDPTRPDTDATVGPTQATTAPPSRTRIKATAMGTESGARAIRSSRSRCSPCSCSRAGARTRSSARRPGRRSRARRQATGSVGWRATTCSWGWRAPTA